MRWRLLIFLGVLFIGLGCADPGGFDEGITQSPNEEGSKFQLLLFSSGWCPNCKVFIPEINTLLKSQLGGATRRLKVVVHAGEGWVTPVPPTEEFLKEYEEYLLAKGVDFEVAPDFLWGTYLDYFKLPISILAAVVLEEDGKLVKTFRGGTYDPKKLVDFIQFTMKE